MDDAYKLDGLLHWVHHIKSDVDTFAQYIELEWLGEHLPKP